MNGGSSAAKGNLSSRLDHKLREMSDRIRNLENRRRVSIGSWLLEENETGDLVVKNLASGAVVLIAEATLDSTEEKVL